MKNSSWHQICEKFKGLLTLPPRPGWAARLLRVMDGEGQIQLRDKQLFWT